MPSWARSSSRRQTGRGSRSRSSATSRRTRRREPRGPSRGRRSRLSGCDERGGVMQNILFLMLVALTTLAFFALIREFLMPVFWAAVLATVFHPLQVRYVAVVGGRRALAALLTMLTI